MSPLGFTDPTPRPGRRFPSRGGGGGVLVQRWAPRKPRHCGPWPGNPSDLAPLFAGYLLSLFAVSLFLLMIGSSAFSNWWLGLWLDEGSQVSVPPALDHVEWVTDRALNAPDTQ